jgi:hypothetical protein
MRLRHSGAQSGDLVAILGIGGLGHLGVQFAAKMGYHTVAIARGADKEPLARELGAHHYIDSTARSVAKALTKLGGARVILATATDSKSMSAAIGGLGIDGKLIIVGAPSEPLEISPLTMIMGRTLHSRLAVGHCAGFGGHAGFQRPLAGSSEDRNLSARACARSLRPHDERQGAVSRGPDDRELRKPCCVLRGACSDSSRNTQHAPRKKMANPIKRA